jgi:ubiquinone/menaquinone biosynthesis C-methylase UbiE
MARVRRLMEGILVGVLDTPVTIQAAYNEWASTYDSDASATRDLDRVVTARGLGTSRFASILEIGCGTGKNTRLLTRIGTRVLALDFSDRMLSHAQRNLQDVPNVVFALADITTGWPCVTRAAHMVTCNLVLEHIQDLSPVFTEAARAGRGRMVLHLRIAPLQTIPRHGGELSTWDAENAGLRLCSPSF